MSMTNAASPNLQAIPHGFETYKQFINWYPQHNGKKIEKIPCSPTGAKIDAHDPANWLDAHTAAASAYGLAFVFTKNDPFFFIDPDSCVDRSTGSPKWTAFAQWVLDAFPGAAFEVSYSGDGFHIFGSGAQALHPDHRCKRKGFPLEIYTSGRFCALTGTNRSGSALTDFSAVLPVFMARCDLEGTKTERDEDLAAVQRDPAYTGPEDDAELLRLMRGSGGSAQAAFGGVHARDLLDGNVPVLAAKWPASGRGDGLTYDASSADAALMSHLGFWTGRDVQRMESLFRQSALWRPGKYEGKGVYRLDRILAVGVGVKKVYDRPVATVTALSGAPSVTATGEPTSARHAARILDLEGQLLHFAGCVYVASHHGVMMSDGRVVKPEVFKALKGGWHFVIDNSGKTTKNAFEAFTESRLTDFPKVTGTCFRPRLPPGEIVDGMVNTWVQPVIDEAEGDITPFLEQLRRMVPDDRDRDILLSYMKALVQCPGVKFQWAPVLQGCQGNGKTMLIRALSYAVGARYSHLPKAEQIVEKFNSWLQGNIFIGVEEINVSEKRETLEILKDAVTNDRIEIRGMGREKTMGENFTNWLFCTNHRDAVPTNREDRRYAVFFTAQQSVDDLERFGMTVPYFRELYAWLNDGGYRAVSWWLRNSPITEEFNPATFCQRAPKTSSTDDAHRESMGRIEQHVMDAIEEGAPGFKNGWISFYMVTRLLTTHGVKIPTNASLGKIIRSLGYSVVVKKTSHLANEDGKRTALYRSDGAERTQEEYIKDQEYVAAPTVSNGVFVP